MKVLLSIKPEFAERIFAGTKRFEFRRTVFRDRRVRTVVVYATRPVGMIIGEFDVEDILHASPDELWIRTAAHAGISRDFFDQYFAGRAVAFALAVTRARLFDPPLDPTTAIQGFTPPQSYMYVNDDIGRRDASPGQYALL